MRILALLAVAVLVGCESPKPRPTTPPVLEMYNVADLVVSGGSFGGAGQSESIPDDTVPDGFMNDRQLTEKVKRAVGVELWDEIGWAIVFQNGLLIVRAPAEIHKEVATVLAGERTRVAARGAPRK